jgi:hypothetical protein
VAIAFLRPIEMAPSAVVTYGKVAFAVSAAGSSQVYKFRFSIDAVARKVGASVAIRKAER